MVTFQTEKGKNSSTKCNISEKDQKSSTKIVPFQKRVKNPRQKMVHFRKGSKFLSKNGFDLSFVFSLGGAFFLIELMMSAYMVPFQKRVKNSQ